MFSFEFQGTIVKMPNQKDPKKMSPSEIRNFLKRNAMDILHAERRMGLGSEQFGDAEFLEYIRLVRAQQK